MITISERTRNIPRLLCAAAAVATTLLLTSCGEVQPDNEEFSVASLQAQGAALKTQISNIAPGYGECFVNRAEYRREDIAKNDLLGVFKSPQGDIVEVRYLSLAHEIGSVQLQEDDQFSGESVVHNVNQTQDKTPQALVQSLSVYFGVPGNGNLSVDVHTIFNNASLDTQPTEVIVSCETYP